jgi:hypothetical protein
MRFRLRSKGEVNIDITDGRDLQIKPLRWSQVLCSKFYKDRFRYSNIISGDTHTDSKLISQEYFHFPKRRKYANDKDTIRLGTCKTLLSKRNPRRGKGGHSNLCSRVFIRD